VPKSRVRRKRDFTPEQRAASYGIKERRWIAPVMLGCFLIGLVYLVVFYLAGHNIPVMQDIGSFWNVAIGFGFILAGFALSTQWR